VLLATRFAKTITEGAKPIVAIHEIALTTTSSGPPVISIPCRNTHSASRAEQPAACSAKSHLAFQDAIFLWKISTSGLLGRAVKADEPDQRAERRVGSGIRG
jgi:hypothetical protein